MNFIKLDSQPNFFAKIAKMKESKAKWRSPSAIVSCNLSISQWNYVSIPDGPNPKKPKIPTQTLSAQRHKLIRYQIDIDAEFHFNLAIAIVPEQVANNTLIVLIKGQGKQVKILIDGPSLIVKGGAQPLNIELALVSITY